MLESHYEMFMQNQQCDWFSANPLLLFDDSTDTKQNIFEKQ